jgi:hypothetical protein
MRGNKKSIAEGGGTRANGYVLRRGPHDEEELAVAEEEDQRTELQE